MRTAPAAGLAASLALLLVTSAVPLAAQPPHFVFDAPRASAAPYPCVRPSLYAELGARLLAMDPAAGEARPEAAQLFPSYAWPLASPLHNHLEIENYVDQDSTFGFLDYTGGARTYDTHAGTDITQSTFRDMDRGLPILAAAPGTVVDVHYDRTDRNIASPWPDDGNWVFVDDGDGTETFYYHMRKNSPAVNVGETVQTGQVLGLVGASGYVTVPHLHFEAGSYPGGVYQRRDPWNGPRNPLPSLWASQLPYVGLLPFHITDGGFYTAASAGGDAFNFTRSTFMERLIQPAVAGTNEYYLPIWFQFQGNVGDHWTFELRKPDNTVYASWPDTLTYTAKLDWRYYSIYFSPYISPSDTGTWTAKFLNGNQVLYQVQQRVGPATVFGPRVSPAVGRSFRVNGAAQYDTLRVSPLGGPVTWMLLGAPSWITLHDSVVTFPAVSPQPYRSYFFQAQAKDAAGRADTAWIHVVDPSKPVNAMAAAGDAPPAAGALSLAPASPNPFRGTTTLAYSVAHGGRVSLRIYDVAGRVVRRLMDRSAPSAENARETWDGRDDAGRRVVPGIYFVRLAMQDESSSRRLVLLN